MTRPASPYQFALRNQWEFIGWCLYHFAAVLCFCVGLYYASRYMLLPDKVLIRDLRGLSCFGHTGPVVNETTAEDIACRAAHAFLDVSTDRIDTKARKAIFGESANSRMKEYQDELMTELAEKNLKQTATVTNVELAMQGQECLAFVDGTIFRDGIYERMPYRQVLSFRMGMRLVRGNSDTEFPLRVLRMNYSEKALYNLNGEEKER